MTTLRIGPSGLVASNDPISDAPKLPEGPAALSVTPAGVSDDFDRVKAAEVSARFATTKAKIPDLMGDWRNATVQASVEESARATFWPEVEAALADAEGQKGDRLSRREVGMIVTAFEEARMPAAIPTVAPAILKNAKTREKAIDDSVASHRQIVAQKKDPFMPVALGDPAARAKEKVLWENKNVMVLVDAFSDKPKALVVPKKPVSFPVDMKKKALDELAKVAAEVSAGFAQATGCQDAEIWINPPQYLTVKQLHVHVGPPLADWDTAKDDQELEKEMNGFWAAMTAVLGQRLKHFK
ncbi:MAG: hypothetical protein IT381_27210 [Deltaproteobacteria bacterium]|nr:hypothetical protein [Deltaproteobacteria bacterium]